MQKYFRIDFETFELRKAKRYTKNEKCIDDLMFILNQAGGPTEGVCEMENHTGKQCGMAKQIHIPYIMQG